MTIPDPRVVVFDCDGVMFDTEEINRRFYNRILAHLDRPEMNPEELTYVHMHTIDESIRFLTDGDAGEMERAYAFRATLPPLEFIRDMVMEPHLRSLLAALRPRFHTAIATNRTDSMDRVLATFDLEDDFDLVVTALDVVRPKPWPDQLEKVGAHFGLTPGQILYIGDSRVDADAAGAAGTWFAAFRNPSLAADFHVSSLAEIPALVGLA